MNLFATAIRIDTFRFRIDSSLLAKVRIDSTFSPILAFANGDVVDNSATGVALTRTSRKV